MGISLDELRAFDSAVDSIEIKTAAGQALGIDASGFITANINGSVVVTATDLDIRALTNVDVVTAEQGGTWNIGTVASITADVNIADGGNSITVDAVDFDVRDLAFASDSVTSHQGGTWSVETIPGGYASWKVSAESVTGTESEIVSTPLSGRLSILVQNLGGKDIYVRDIAGVSTSNGMKIPKFSSFSADLDDGANLFVISDGGSSDVRITEYAA